MLDPDKWVLILTWSAMTPGYPPAVVPVAEYGSKGECVQGAALTISAMETEIGMKGRQFGFGCVPLWTEPYRAVIE
jgi:hypothetical protein